MSTKETPPTDSEPSLISVQSLDGENTVEVNNAQAYALMQMGLETLKEESKPAKESEPEPETIEDKFEALNKKFNEQQEKTKRKEKSVERLTKLNNLCEKSDYLKENPEYARHVKALVLSGQVADPRLDTEKAVVTIINDLQKIDEAKDKRKKDKKTGTDTVRNALSGIDSGGTGLASIGKDKEWTSKEVDSGEAKLALEELLKTSGGV